MLRLILSSPVSGNTSLAALLVASPAPHSAHRGIQSKAVPVFTLCTRLSTPHTQQVTGYNSSQFTVHTPVHQSTTGTRLWLWTTRGLRRRMGARSLKCDCAYRCTGGDPEPNLFSVLPRSDALPLIGILGRFLQSYPRSITTPPPPATHDIYLSGGRHSGQLSHLSPIPAPLFSCNASLVALHPTLRHSLHAR